MSIDPKIREQTYPYFLQEATELLQTLEQGLLNLREDFSLNNIHSLMRVTHTLKGAAASVELETIAVIAHALEDIFKALYQPGVFIDSDVEALLFEGYDCLSLALATELTNEPISNSEILDRAATVFAQLHEKLGDWMGQEAHLPTSADLGFDVVQSMFEVGVAQRLDQIATAIDSAQPQTMAAVLRTQAEVFFGLAESLNLPGFGTIAQAAIMALDNHPEQVVTVARCALSDLRAGQAAVLAGDRTQGGQPSQKLQHLAGYNHAASKIQRSGEWTGAESMPEEREITEVSANSSALATSHSRESGGFRKFFNRFWQFIADEPDDELEVPPAAAGRFQHPPQSSGHEPPLEEPVPHLLESIWGGYVASDSPPQLSASGVAANSDLEEHSEPDATTLTTRLATLAPDEPEATIQPLPLPRQSSTLPPLLPEKTASQKMVRVNVEDLKYLSYSIGELLTNQNYQLLQHEQLQAEIRSLLKRLKRHQQQLNHLYEYPIYSSIPSEQWHLKQQKSEEKPKEINAYTPALTERKDFDVLELDRYNDSHLFIQSLLDDTVQLSEAAEAADLFARQSSQTLEKQRLLLSNARNALIDARMLALGEILNRFPSVLQQLETLHNKPVSLTLQGTEVLVDKVVAERLYEPLLHLVRNAFDHGIEPVELRQQRQKPEKGQLKICAYHQSRYLTIKVRDDGEGLDFERIRQRAIEAQLIPPVQASSLSQSQLTDLLFEPGFSTAAQVNTLSGRGIGLDVVRSQLKALEASITVHSKLHQGTTFILQIPLDLVITKLLICQANSQSYAFLTDAVEQILVPQSHQIRERESGKVLRWGKDSAEQLVPIYSLSEILTYRSSTSHPSQTPAPSHTQPRYIILIRCSYGLVGLEVDQLAGEQELVIRPLGTAMELPSYIQGASILADGQLTLVIAAAELLQQKVFEPQRNSDSSPTAATHSPAETVPMLSATLHQQLPAQNQTALVMSPDFPLQASLSPAILIVEDSITARQTLALALQKVGYQVLQAKDGHEALEQLQQQSDIQLVICDLEMPRMNGFEFLSCCQRNPALADLPIIILTSRSSEKHRLLASQLGATAYITKPYIEHKLLEMVAKLLEPAPH
ncbi:hybrid sensor histidine kinase/response regulator [Phormidium tenue FACHB-886]|nr:hybrid sensor histidine kinase/response regulator [Phormidium tenue FACHB-886]